MNPPLPRGGVLPASAGALRVSEVTTLEGLRALQPAWEPLLAASETSTPFLTFEWVLTWWESFGAGQELWVLVVEDAEGIAAIAPFARARRRAGPLTYRALELIGTGALRFLGMGLADRADLLLARRREECARLVLERLAAERHRFDVVDLRFLPDTSTTARVFREGAGELGLGVAVEPLSESPYLRFEGSFEDYAARRGRNFRKGLKRRQEKLESTGAVAFDIDAARRDPAHALAAAIEVSLASWKEHEGTALFLHASVRRFFAALVPRLAERDRVFIALLSVDGRPAAHEFGYRLNNKLWSYDSAYRIPYATGSPGTLLTARVIEGAIAEGLAEYDFLRGNEDYKTSWDTASRHELQLVLDSGSRRGALARDLAFRLKWALKRRRPLVTIQGRLAGWLNRVVERQRKPRG